MLRSQYVASTKVLSKYLVRAKLLKNQRNNQSKSPNRPLPSRVKSNVLGIHLTRGVLRPKASPLVGWALGCLAQSHFPLLRV